jgi:hypothetical protein
MGNAAKEYSEELMIESSTLVVVNPFVGCRDPFLIGGGPAPARISGRGFG